MGGLRKQGALHIRTLGEDAMQDVELDEVQWRSPEWIQAFGLNTANVLDYFALSPFYDRSSNNQVLKMQTNFNEQLASRGSDLTRELQNMRGLEFVVASAREPDMWVIRKQNRRGPQDVEIVNTYFVVGDNVYQAPSCYNAMSSRILATSLFLGRGLQAAQQLASMFSESGAAKLAGEEKAQPVDPESEDQPQESISEKERRSEGLERSLEIALSLER